MTPYVQGHFQKPGGQLYVNRGIGTIAIPIRFDSPPEITLFELVKAEPFPCSRPDRKVNAAQCVNVPMVGRER